MASGVVLMKAGELDCRITFQHKTIAYNNTLNEPIETWTAAFTRYAGVAENGSKELYQAQKLYTETSAVFKIRFTERVNNRMRIKYGNRIFEILGAPIPAEKRTQLNVFAKEVV